jgi:GxxExxY protein
MIDSHLHSEITSKIIKAYYKVYNKLGYGFLEKVYENALLVELRKSDLKCCKQTPIEVYYDQNKVGFYIADIIVEDSVIIEIKAAECLSESHEAQLTNYLRATDIEVGILLNFGKKPEFKRKVFSTEFKNHDLS